MENQSEPQVSVPSSSACASSSSSAAAEAPVAVWAVIKPEFRKPNVVLDNSADARDDDESEGRKRPQSNSSSDKGDQRGGKKGKKDKGHANTNRPRNPMPVNYCHQMIEKGECDKMETCKFNHDLASYITSKPADIGPTCVHFELKGKCPYGVTCRFSSSHTTPEGRPIVNEERLANPLFKPEFNHLPRDAMISLTKRKYQFPRTKDTLAALDRVTKQMDQARAEHQRFLKQQQSQEAAAVVVAAPVIPADIDFNAFLKSTIAPAPAAAASPSAVAAAAPSASIISPFADTTIDLFEERLLYQETALLRREKPKIDFNKKLVLAPLTTNGNLPFRRICKGFGVDITVSEMAVATNLLQAQPSELALLKRHACEDIFGVQIAASSPENAAQVCELLSNSEYFGGLGGVSFVDLNCGCPIDIMYERGMGSALLERHNRLERIVNAMDCASEMPITVKIRIGKDEKNPTSHTLVPRLQRAGAAAVTIHGRSRLQRYTKLANWNYIEQCAQVIPTLPVIGNGDVYSWQDVEQHYRECPSLQSIMIGRGALIKPWLFQEIKEERTWDISSSERLDILKQFVNYGLEHWGSDDRGVNNTRRFLLEWLSFLYRYIPVGVLEVVPVQMTQKPPPFVGRNDLETLMASPDASDWVKISEMLLGPTPDDFDFVPKHSSNAWSSTANNG